MDEKEYRLLTIDCRDKVEMDSYKDYNVAEGAYRSHCYHYDDKYIVLLEYKGRSVKPLFTCYRRV